MKSHHASLHAPATIATSLAALFATSLVHPAVADLVCPDSSYCQASFATSRDHVRTAPGVDIESLAAAGITITVYLKDCSGVPLVGVPAENIVLYNSNLCLCPGGNVADAATDSDGRTTFTGSLRAGGCGQNLQVIADGMTIGTVPVKTRSPDVHDNGWQCSVDPDDLAPLASLLGARLGHPGYDPCFDFDGSGVIDASELECYAWYLGSRCPRLAPGAEIGTSGVATESPSSGDAHR